jgi:hypothetical protein
MSGGLVIQRPAMWTTNGGHKGGPDQGRLRQSHPFVPNSRSSRLEDEVRLEALTPHHGTEKDGFEFAAVIGEVTMRLAEDRNDLRHLETELAVLVGERGSP